MAWNGSGTFNRDYNWTSDASASIPIRADRMDNEFINYKGGLENCLTRTGETAPTANISWNNFKIVNLADATNFKDAVNVKKLQDGNFIWGGTSTGAANTYVIATIPAITAYVVGMTLRFLAHQTNTSALATLDAGAGALTFQKSTGGNPSPGDIISGAIVEVTYDGTYWRLNSVTLQQIQSGGTQWGGTSTGTPNIYEISLSPPLKAYSTGLTVNFLTHQANTIIAAPTLNVDSLGPKTILRPDGSAMRPNDLPNATVVTVIYDGTNFRLVSDALTASIAGEIVQVVHATTSASALLPVIPADNTIPQDTEGTQVLTASITPKSLSNKILVIYNGFASDNATSTGGSYGFTSALFKPGNANAIRADSSVYGFIGGTATVNTFKNHIEYLDSPGSLSSVTYNIRAGSTDATNQVTFNQVYVSGFGFMTLGGTMSSTLTLMEITA